MKDTKTFTNGVNGLENKNSKYKTIKKSLDEFNET